MGELVALTTRRVSLKRRRIEVVEAITEVHGRLVVGTTKTHQRRLVPVPRFLADELAADLATKAPGDLVFTAPEGGGAAEHQFPTTVLRPDRREGGAASTHPHELRHTAASLAVAAGANFKAVQQMLGHASEAMTLDLYAGLFADDLDAVADRLDGAVAKLNADQMRTKRRTRRSDHTELPFREPARTGHWLAKRSQSRLGESNPGPTHYERVQRSTVRDGCCPLALWIGPTVRGRRWLLMDGWGHVRARGTSEPIRCDLDESLGRRLPPFATRSARQVSRGSSRCTLSPLLVEQKLTTARPGESRPGPWRCPDPARSCERAEASQRHGHFALHGHRGLDTPSG
jgi:hypothetical protein